jgi:DNA-binding CsgD family transcriptional regulator
MTVATQIPAGGNLASGRAEWAQKLVAALFGPGDFPREQLVLPVLEKAKVIACVAWHLPGCDGLAGRLLPQLAAVRGQVRKAHALEKARSEAEALRWVLSGSDRLCAVARPDGELLGASLATCDLLKKMRFGPRHFFHEDSPELPPRLVKSICQSSSGQVPLTTACTARFEQLGLSRASWMPVVGIECFAESESHLPLPVSRLTAVERDIYEQIVVGATTREIARYRGTSFATVKNQVSQILQKMGVSRRMHLLARPDSPRISHELTRFSAVRGATIHR